MLAAEALYHAYAGREIIRGFSYAFAEARIYGVIGPNGAGKSTLLRLLTGMERPVSGRMIYRESQLTRPNLEISCLWQQPYLFRATVAENIAYPLRIRRWTTEERRLRISHLLDLFHLEHLRDRPAARISVGEGVRVALARAIAPRPRILVLDEPTANLDPGITRLVEETLAALQDVEARTVILVTHDMFQAKRTADITLFLSHGELVEAGPTERIFSSPSVPETESFIHGELRKC